MEPGLYEQLLTDGLELDLHDALEGRLVPDREALDEEEAPEALADHVRRTLARSLRSLPSDGRLARQVAICNDLIRRIEASTAAVSQAALDVLIEPARVLTSLLPSHDAPFSVKKALARPLTPLSQDAILVNAPREPSMGSQVARELESADSVDLICAFFVMSGVRILDSALARLRERGVRLRVITTTYMGATEPRALERLVELGAEVRVSYDTRQTRLHAKAWLFERRSGFSTAFIGSSNVSHSALHEGLEWNVRLSEHRSPELVGRWRSAFDAYWDDPQFEPYDAERFSRAVRHETIDRDVDFTAFDVVPYQFQTRMLYDLQVERERHGHWRNLLVAATGTGKTVVAAFDYRRLAAEWNGASLLFVAHRAEILRQSLWTFRAVLRDSGFGDLFVGGHQPDEQRHVFASVQSLANVNLDTLDPSHFDVVIIDEFHHGVAPTYRQLLEHLRPRLLLGLTATPERLDGQDITQWFDGRIAVELRLWDALQQGLLCPFQYFGIADEIDLSSVRWSRGGYDIAGLSRIYTGNDARLARVLRAIRELVADARSMRALGFCVSVEHAEYMAAAFNSAGIPSAAVSAQHTDLRERADALRRLRGHELNVIFAVDLFNEGVDVPEVDTVLFLRPTESVTVFLQQLGRGLRQCEGKGGLTVLDFIGQQNRKFRFDERFRQLTGASRREIAKQVAEGFPFLPPGCAVSLDRVSRDIVVANIKEALRLGRGRLATELRRLGDVSMATFLAEMDLDPIDMYRSGRGGWFKLRREAGLPAPPVGPDEDRLGGNLGRLCHISDRERIGLYRRMFDGPVSPPLDAIGERQTRLLTMLHFDVWRTGQAHSGLAASIGQIWANPAIRTEVVELLDVLDSRADHLEQPLDIDDAIPLHVHARYSRDEILAAMGEATLDRPPQLREGVRHVARHRADILLVTLSKSERDFSPSTMYRDYSISPRLFHWESQSTTAASSPTGRRYAGHGGEGGHILLFVREAKRSAGDPVPYLFAGPVHYRSHQGDRPMAITWELETELPPDFFEAARAVA